MKYAIETGSGSMIYIQSFIDWFSHSEVERGYTDTQHGDCISLLLFFQNKKQAKIVKCHFNVKGHQNYVPTFIPQCT
jgi:hypothetical protein